MYVQHGGLYPGVTELFLDQQYVSPAVDEVGGE